MAKAKKTTKHKINVTGAFSLFPQSVRAVQNNLSAFVILSLLPLATTIGSAIASNNTTRSNDISSFGAATGLPVYAIGGLAGFGIIVFILVIIASLFIRAMLYGLQLAAAQGKSPDMSALWVIGKKYWLRVLGLSILTGIAVVIGFVLLIIPGIFVMQRLFLAPYIMIDKDTGIVEAMRRSNELSKPYFGAIWGVIGVTILLSLTGSIPIAGSIIALVLTTLYSVAPAMRYLELKKLEA